MRKELRLDLKIFLFLIDLCVCNSYCFHEQIRDREEPKICIREFKRRIAYNLASKNALKELTTPKVENHFMLKFKFDHEEAKSKKKKMKKLRRTLHSAMKRHKFVTSTCCKCNLPFYQPCFTKHHCPSIIAKDEEKEVVASLKKSKNPHNLCFDISDI